MLHDEEKLKPGRDVEGVGGEKKGEVSNFKQLMARESLTE